jgi:hypothetical protein
VRRSLDIFGGLSECPFYVSDALNCCNELSFAFGRRPIRLTAVSGPSKLSKVTSNLGSCCSAVGRPPTGARKWESGHPVSYASSSRQQRTMVVGLGDLGEQMWPPRQTRKASSATSQCRCGSLSRLRKG